MTKVVGIRGDRTEKLVDHGEKKTALYIERDCELRENVKVLSSTRADGSGPRIPNAGRSRSLREWRGWGERN